jgi:hypothetical protein
MRICDLLQSMRRLAGEFLVALDGRFEAFLRTVAGRSGFQSYGPIGWHPRFTTGTTDQLTTWTSALSCCAITVCVERTGDFLDEFEIWTHS